MKSLRVDDGIENAPPEVLHKLAARDRLFRGGQLAAEPYGEAAGDPPDEGDDDYDSSTGVALTDVDAEAQAVPALKMLPTPPVKMGPMEALLAHIKEGKREPVRFVLPFGSVSLRALYVSVNATGVGLILAKDEFEMELRTGLELTMTYRGSDYQLIYGGGFFTFSGLPVTFLSFFLVSDGAQDHGEKRQS